MNLKLLPVLIIWGIYPAILVSQSFQFLREKIEIEVRGNYCLLTGKYYFENPGFNDARGGIYYPFVINNQLPYPDSIDVTDVKNNSDVEFSKSRTGITFPVKIQPNSISEYKVFYKQKTSYQKMEYILITTHAWKKPLSSAEFIIRIPDKFVLTFLSYKPDKIERNGDFQAYFISKENFLPGHNLIVQWRKKGE